MKKAKAIAVIFILTIMTPIVLGERTKKENLPVAFVDLDRVSRQAIPVQKAISHIEKTLRPKQNEIEKKMEELDLLKLRLRRQRSLLSEEEIKRRQEKIKRLEDEIRQMTEEVNRFLDRMETERLGPAYDIVIKAIKNIAERRGIKVVLPSEMIIYATPEADITEQVIKELNTQYSDHPTSPTNPQN